MNEEKYRKIAKLIVLTYTSLESHLYWFYKDRKKDKHHINAIKDYAEMIKLLSELYEK